MTLRGYDPSRQDRYDPGDWRAELEDRVRVPEYLGTSTVQGRPTPTPTPIPSAACTYSLEIREHGHSLTTLQLSLETLTKLVLTVGRQFAEEMAVAPAWDRHSLYMEIRPEISTAVLEGI